MKIFKVVCMSLLIVHCGASAADRWNGQNTTGEHGWCPFVGSLFQEGEVEWPDAGGRKSRIPCIAAQEDNMTFFGGGKSGAGCTWNVSDANAQWSVKLGYPGVYDQDVFSMSIFATDKVTRLPASIRVFTLASKTHMVATPFYFNIENHAVNVLQEKEEVDDDAKKNAVTDIVAAAIELVRKKWDFRNHGLKDTEYASDEEEIEIFKVIAGCKALQAAMFVVKSVEA